MIFSAHLDRERENEPDQTAPTQGFGPLPTSHTVALPVHYKRYLTTNTHLIMLAVCVVMSQLGSI